MGDYEIDMNMLQNICPIYNDYKIDDITGDNNTYNFTQLEGEIMLLKDKYFAKVEYGNEYIDQLNRVEKNYFSKKYGPEIYEYLKSKRDAFITNKTESTCQSILSGDGSMNNISQTDISNLLLKLQSDVSNEYQTYNSISNTDISLIKNNDNNTSVIMNELKQLYSLIGN